jgi:transposase
MNIQKLDYNPLTFDEFIGMDVDKKSISISVYSHAGFVKSLHTPYGSDHVITYIQKRFPDKRVILAYEAGPTGFGLYDDLTKAGYLCLVIATQNRRSTADRVKTNRLDSRKIAEDLRGGKLRSIHVPAECYRHLRHLTRLREMFIYQIRAWKLRIKATLLLEGIPYPSASPRNQWSPQIIEMLKQIKCQPAIRFKLDYLISALENSNQQMKEVSKQIITFSKQDLQLSQYLELLQTIPGIGPVVGSYLLARIGDPSQITNSRQLASFLGLIPTENSTGDRIRRGNITHLGDPILRSKLIETAWTAVRDDAEIRTFYQRIKMRHPAHLGPRKAVVAVARKLSVRIFVVLKNKVPYALRPITQS